MKRFPAAATARRTAAIFRILWRAGRWRVALFALLVLAGGLLPTGLILVTGELVSAIPAAVRHGLADPAGEPAVLALAGLVLGLAALSIVTNALSHTCRVLNVAYALEAHRTVASATLGTPGLAPLEDPAFADELEAVRQAERRDILRWTTSALSGVATTRLRGIGAFVVLLGYAWWAPVLLLAAWHLTNLVYHRSTETGVSVEMSDGAPRLRRAEYLRSLAVEPAAAKEVRVFGLGPWMVGRYAEVWADALGVMWESRRASRGLTAAAALLLVLSHAAVLGALGVDAAQGVVGTAALLVFTQAVIATSDLGLIGEWQWILAQGLGVAEVVERIRARALATAATDRPAPAELPPGRIAVRLDGVRFRYRGRPEPTLDGLTLDIPAGQSLAVVGENGAGKSTLIKLLCGLYEPDAGRITLGGSASPLEARGRIAAIFQDFVRYPLPLRENVGFGALPLLHDDAALRGALHDAGGDELAAALPHGWDTVLSREFEGGADLSGGQWQRVALARAMAAVRGGAGLLILDEPTAALDVRAETQLFERFLELTRGVTTILVSHRLSSVRRADRIVVVEGGRVVEDGTHDALMRRGGRYARMYTLQAERFAAGEAVEHLAGEEVAHA